MLEGSATEKVCLLSLLNDESYARSTDDAFVSKLTLERRGREGLDVGCPSPLPR